MEECVRCDLKWQLINATALYFADRTRTASLYNGLKACRAGLFSDHSTFHDEDVEQTIFGSARLDVFLGFTIFGDSAISLLRFDVATSLWLNQHLNCASQCAPLHRTRSV